MYALMTPDGNGGWILPVARVMNTGNFRREFVHDGDRRILIWNLPPAEQLARGYFPFSENRVDQSVSIAGVPVDILGADEVTRTYPNAALKPDGDLRALMYDRLGAERYGQETGGITVSSMEIPSDRIDRALIKHALETIGDAPATMPFKVAPGTFVDVDKVTMAAIWNAVTAHVEHCFNQEKTHATAIAGATGQAILDYDISTGWTV